MAKIRKTVNYGGKMYIGETKCGSLHVRVQKTANGQMLLAGVYNFETGTWQNGKRNNTLPGPVKQEFEVAFD